MKARIFSVLSIFLFASSGFASDAEPATQSIRLDAGWNLISFQVLPENRSPSAALASLPVGAVDSLWCYDAASGQWRSWFPDSELDDGDSGSISALNYFQGYWLKTNVPGLELTVVGQRPENGAMFLVEGWNLIGFPAAEAGEAGLAQIDAIFRSHVQGSDPDVDLIYTFNGDGDLLRWDFSIDRKAGDFNADGVVNFNDQQFQIDFDVPDDDPALAEATPSADDFIGVFGGEGYWVHATRSFSLTPILKILIASDIDSAPIDNFPGPEDVDYDQDGVFDSGIWQWPNDVEGSTQDLVLIPSGQSTAQLVINNAGEGILKWNVAFVPGPDLATHAPEAVMLDLTEGQTLTDTDTLRISVDRTGLPPGTYGGELVLTSTGGARSLRLDVEVPEILGDFRGYATIDSVDGKPIQLPDLDLFVSFFRSADGSIRGQIRSDQSSHFPVPIPLQGELLTEGSGEFVSVASYNMPSNAILVRDPGTLNFTIAEGPSDPELFNVNTINPFPRPVYRELILQGARVREDIGLEGDFYDTLIGATADPIVMRGHFELVRESLEPTFQPSAGSTSPCTILGSFSQSIPDTDQEKFFTLGQLGCDPITDSILIEDVMVYAKFADVDYGSLRVRLLAPWDDELDPASGVLLFDGASPGAPAIVADDLSWPVLFSDAVQGLFPQAGMDALADAYRGARADGNGGGWRLGVTDQSIDGVAGRLTQWTLSFNGTEVFELDGRVVSGGAPLAGVTVGLTGSESVRTATTGSDGGFVFSNLSSHRYRLSLDKPGFSYVGDTGALRVDLQDDTTIGDLVMALAPQIASELLISPPRGRVARGAGGSILPFSGTLRYVASELIDGDLYQFEFQSYSPTTGAAIGSPVLIPQIASPDPLVPFELTVPGTYSVTAKVYRNAELVDTVGEPEPRALEAYTIVVEDTLPVGATAGQMIYLVGATFASGGVIPGDLYPPGSDTDAPPGVFLPVGEGNTATYDFTYRVSNGGSTATVKLGEDMAQSTTIDLNRPSARPNFDVPFDPDADAWTPNNPDLVGGDINVGEPLLGNPSNDFGRGPVNGVGRITYDLLPGDGAPGPLTPPNVADEADRTFIMTSSLGGPITGRSMGAGFAITGGARFELFNEGQTQE